MVEYELSYYTRLLSTRLGLGNQPFLPAKPSKVGDLYPFQEYSCLTRDVCDDIMGSDPRLHVLSTISILTVMQCVCSCPTSTVIYEIGIIVGD